MSTTTDRRDPPDQDERNRIQSELTSTLFVEAGAGSGKTTALVDRVVALVASGVELSRIAAITFSEKAGAELRARVRRTLQERAESGDASAERCQVALGQLDGAAIGTLHSFAQRILAEHPVEARLPPKIEVLDEVSSAVAFDRRWARILDDLLADPTLERTILLLHAANVDPAKLRSLALAFEGSWDLVEELVPVDCPEPPRLADLVPKVQAEIAGLAGYAEVCVDPSDALLDAVVRFADFAEQLTSAGDDDLDLLDVLLGGVPTYRKGCGKAPSWRGRKDEVHAQLTAIKDAVASIHRGVLDGCAHRLGSAVRHHTLETADRRRKAGTLEFHDLLVLARKVLRDPDQGPIVRASLHDRYQRVLLDEFQDTDPIQIELAVRIAAAHPSAAEHPHWGDVPVEAGRLFVVGDPKQSIYRFRRADITTFIDARDRFGPEGGGTVQLTANFRTGEPIIDWVNHTFTRLFDDAVDTDLPYPSQPDYVGLQAQRPAAPVGPPMAVVGVEPHPYGTGADEVRTAEGRDVANAIVTAMIQGWLVDDHNGGWRPCRLGDITILVPARTTLPFLESALEAAAIPYRAESSSLVYATRAVRDLLMVLRAADDPTDHLRIVSALRTPLLACGDDDLFRHKVIEGRGWAYNTPEPPDPADGVVSAGLAFLREINEARHWSSPAELLDRIARDRRALELAFVEGRPRDVWRRLRFVIDQARAWSEATGGSLRAYLHWVEQQTAEGSRVAESVLPETDDDAVRVMTIHAAKGLEFPITIVSGLSARSGGRRNAVEVHFPRHGATGRVGYRMGKDVITDEFQAAVPFDEQMGYDERLRLLYVACTRACDHLVLSMHRVERKNPPALKRNRTNAEVLHHGMGELFDALPDLSGEAQPLPIDPQSVPTAPTPFATWEAERAAALAIATRPGAVAATALTEEGTPDPSIDPAVDPGLQKRPRDLDLPPWLKGRYGTAVGRAVHGVLQTIDLATGDGLDAAVAAQCQAEAVVDRIEIVSQLVRDALGSTVVQAAAAARHWREVYACTPIGDRLLEGYVDLLFRDAEGLVVVDYKTSASSEPADLDERVAGYRLQGAAYAVTVGQATGEPVTRVAFLFLTPAGAIERDLTDLDAAMADVHRLVRAGEELVTT